MVVGDDMDLCFLSFSFPFSFITLRRATYFFGFATPFNPHGRILPKQEPSPL